MCAADVSSQCPPTYRRAAAGVDDNNAIGRRGPDKLAALQAAGVKRHAQTVMPKHLHEVAPASTEHEEITGVRSRFSACCTCRARPCHATARMCRMDPSRSTPARQREWESTPRALGHQCPSPWPGSGSTAPKCAANAAPTTPARSAACHRRRGRYVGIRPAQIARSQQA